MTRDVRWPAAVAFGFAISILLPAQAGASVAQDAKKICLERYNAEKAGGTLPDGMAKAKYLSQCTKSYIHNAQLENGQAQQGAANGAAQNPPGAALTVKTADTVKPAKPASGD